MQVEVFAHRVLLRGLQASVTLAREAAAHERAAKAALAAGGDVDSGDSGSEAARADRSIHVPAGLRKPRPSGDDGATDGEKPLLSPAAAGLIMTALVDLVSEPSFVNELFVNYDCDPARSDTLTEILFGCTTLVR